MAKMLPEQQLSEAMTASLCPEQKLSEAKTYLHSIKCYAIAPNEM
jgi:hypothetical protein